MVAADVRSRAARAEVDELREILTELAELADIREGAVETIGRGLEGIERARMALTQAISDRTDLPERVATDDAAMLALIDAAETLDAFAANFAATGSAARGAGFSEARGNLPLPVAGRVLRRAGEGAGGGGPSGPGGAPRAQGARARRAAGRGVRVPRHPGPTTATP